MTRHTVVGPYGVEAFDVRIAPEGFFEWLNKREQLKADGYPDRPPDVDSPTLRAWLPHPGEEDLPYFAAHPTPDIADRLADPVLTLSWDGVPQVRMHVLGLRDGAFEVKVLYDHEIIAGRDYPPEMSPDAVWRDIEEQATDLNERFVEPPRVTTYTDFAAFDIEIELAAADIQRGFINPLPEGPVQ